MTFRIHRAIACAFALAAVGLFAAGAAPAADGDTGTVVIHQRSNAGSPAEGGCYNVVKLDGDGAGHWKYVCDDDDDADGGEVTIAELPPSGYRLEEEVAPAEYKTAQPASFTVTVGAGDTVTLTRLHEPLPPLRVVTKDEKGAALAGSCWVIQTPDEDEGWIARLCDADDGAADGTTTFRTIRPGDYKVVHMEAPVPYHRIDDPVHFSMPDADQTLTFTLEREIAPANTAAPTVTGRAAVGETLTGARGTWTGTWIDFVDSWERCDGSGLNCISISGSIGNSTYTLTTDDLGKTLRFAVAGSNTAGRAVAVSMPVSVLSLDAPVNTVRPTITGALEPGQRLTGNPGAWTGAPTFSYQWQHCTAGSCVDIDRATGSTYVLATSDADFGMRLVVTARNDAGSATAASGITGQPND